MLTNNPNDIFRPWLEANVGQQGLDWDWRIVRDTFDMIEIRFSRSKESLAVQVALMWGD